jgi:hypothetical protein
VVDMSTPLPVVDDGVDIEAQAPRLIAKPAAAAARESLTNEKLGMMGFR